MNNYLATVMATYSYVGIDPGSSSGAICVIKDYEQSESSVFIAPLSKYTDKDIFNVIKGACLDVPEGCVKGVVEAVHAFPGQGVSSTFKFGKNYGELRMALIAAEIPFNEVTPRSWQKFYGMKKDKEESKPQWKVRLRQRAEQLYPKVKLNNQTADSLLIAHYCKNTLL